MPFHRVLLRWCYFNTMSNFLEDFGADVGWVDTETGQKIMTKTSLFKPLFRIMSIKKDFIRSRFWKFGDHCSTNWAIPLNIHLSEVSSHAIMHVHWHFFSCEDKYTIERVKSQDIFAKCVAFAERFYILAQDVCRIWRNTRPIHHFCTQVLCFKRISTFSLRAANLRLKWYSRNVF